MGTECDDISPPKDQRVDRFLERVRTELQKATHTYGKFHSLHEAYAVILEEVDELWQEVRDNHKYRDYANVRNELVQIAAMCVRTALDMNVI